MAADRERAAAEKQREAERNDPTRRRKEIEVGSVVRRPVATARRVGGVTASSSGGGARNGGSGGGSVVKKPQIKRKPGRAF